MIIIRERDMEKYLRKTKTTYSRLSKGDKKLKYRFKKALIYKNENLINIIGTGVLGLSFLATAYLLDGDRVNIWVYVMLGVVVGLILAMVFIVRKNDRLYMETIILEELLR